jgi:hypothetical protein
MKGLFSFILIFFTLALFWNNAVNRHYHQLPNGIVVEHAHPYNKTDSGTNSPFQNHRHNDLEYLILDLVYNAVSTIVPAVMLVKVMTELKPRKLLLRPLPVIGSVYFRLPLLRAPPLN